MAQNDMVKPLPVKMAEDTNPALKSPGADKAVPAVKVKPKSANPVQSNLCDDLTQFNQDDLVKGFVFSLILDKPRCKQRGRR